MSSKNTSKIKYPGYVSMKQSIENARKMGTKQERTELKLLDKSFKILTAAILLGMFL